jgi:hypothetical protein
VYSPSFDFNQYTNPAIRFNYARDFDSNRDGVVLQVSDDDGRTWQTLGDNMVNSGYNWYTHQGISSGPGDGQGRAPEGGVNATNPDLVGFADVKKDDLDNPTPEWLEARHQVTRGDYVNDNIRFRFVLSSISGKKINTTTGNIADGFAFDDFRIYEINKLLVVEQFSSTLSQESKDAEEFIYSGTKGGPIVHSIDWEAGTQGVMINYYTDIYNSGTDIDPINALNRVDPSTRSTFYGITDVPESRIAGEEITFDIVNTPEDFGNSFNALSLFDPDFQVNKNHPNPAIVDDIYFNASGPNEISVTAIFRSLVDQPENVEIGFFFAVVEKERTNITSGVYGPTDIVRYPLRVLLPGAGGNYYRGPLVQNQELTQTMNWTISGVDNPDNLRVIAFAQYYSHPNGVKVGNIEQAAWLDVFGEGKTEVVTGLEDLLSKDVLQLYPNPANARVNLKLADAPLKPIFWRISDQSGKEVLVGRIERGIKEITIDTDNLPSGLYIIQIFNEENTWIPKKLIISH